jgi:hypothetical protein
MISTRQLLRLLDAADRAERILRALPSTVATTESDDVAAELRVYGDGVRDDLIRSLPVTVKLDGAA